MPVRICSAFILPVLFLGLATADLLADEIAGTYQHTGTIPATLEVSRQADEYLVRLEGGTSPDAGAATPADCVIEARGIPEKEVLRARFGPVETETFSYDKALADREVRFVEIVFELGSAQIRQADTLGYCALGVEFAGSYQKVEKSSVAVSPATTSAAMFLQDMLNSAGRDVSRMKGIQAQIRGEMTKQNIPSDISITDFVRRSDPQFEQQRKDVATGLGWRP